jgi:predicted dienelactone hydrolase
LLFSHGNNSASWLSKYLGEFLASHGWVVVAPNHTGNTIYDWDGTRLGELIFRRPLDISESADWIFTQADAVLSGLGDCLDEAQGFAVAGHSFGGFTSAAISGVRYDLGSSGYFCGEHPSYWLCDEVQEWIAAHPEYGSWDFSDERVWASIPMAAAGYEVLIGGLQYVEVPTMALGGSLDSVTSMTWSVNLIYDGIGTDDKYLGELHEAGHSAFMHLCELWPELTECREPFRSQSESHALIQTTTLAFLRTVRGDLEAADYLPTASEDWSFTEGPR